jgi:hypothetical protein
MAKFSSFRSSVVLKSKQSSVLIIKLGRKPSVARQFEIDESNGLEVTTCTTYLVLAPSIDAAIRAIKASLPIAWQWAIEESGSTDQHTIFSAFLDSWGPYSVISIGHDGTSGQGAIAWSWVQTNLTPKHLELALTWLFEVLEVNV